jgi:hypothetical protein
MKKGKKRWINDMAVTLYYQGETRKCFGEDINHLKHKIPEAIQRQWKLRANMNIDGLRKISNNEWHGFTIAITGERINYIIFDRRDLIKEAAKLLGQVGGQAGTGKKKVRGDSNYYRVLRMKGVEKKKQIMRENIKKIKKKQES